VPIHRRLIMKQSDKNGVIINIATVDHWFSHADERDSGIIDPYGLIDFKLFPHFAWVEHLELEKAIIDIREAKLVSAVVLFDVFDPDSLAFDCMLDKHQSFEFVDSD